MNEEIIIPENLVRSFFDKKWSEDDSYKNSLYETSEVNLSENSLLFEFMRLLKKTDLILDLGSGDGRVTLKLAKDGFKNIEAIDFSSGAIERLNKLKKMNNYTIKTRVEDLNKLLLKSNTYDSIICVSTLHYFSEEEIKFLLEKIDFALKLGGIIYLTFESNLELKTKEGVFFRFANQPNRSVKEYELLINDFLKKNYYAVKYSKIHSKTIFPTLPLNIADLLNSKSERYIRKMQLYEIVLEKSKGTF